MGQVNSALNGITTMTHFHLSANKLVDTGIYLNKSMALNRNFNYRKSFILILTCLNGNELSVGNRIYNLVIGRNGNTFDKILIEERTSSSTKTYLDNVEFLPSSNSTENNDNNTLCLRLNTATTSMIVSAIFL